MTVRTYRRLLAEAADVGGAELRAVGSRLARRLDRRWPELVAELEGLAAGARQDTEEVIALNARTELLAGRAVAECSVIGHLNGRSVALAQTWDWHPDLAGATVVWTVVKPDATWFTTATEAGILGKLGVNGHGVACGLNFLTCSADGGVEGVPIHVALRLVLEHGVSASRARHMLRSLQTSASSCVTVAAAGIHGGELFAAELSPGGTRIVEADQRGWLVHTNHFLAAPRAGIDTQPDLNPGTLVRRAHLRDLLDAGATPLEALASHEPTIEPVCRHHDPPGTAWADRYETLLALWVEPSAPSLRIAAGPPCTAPFQEIDLPMTGQEV